MFGSRSILQHVLRGMVGLGLLAAAFIYLPTEPVVGLLALPLALVALRGCPMCWTVGLLETIAMGTPFVNRKSSCKDGRCAPDRESAGEPSRLKG